MEEKNDDQLFDGLLKSVGHYGFFQKRFLIIFNFGFIALSSMVLLNLVMDMDVPEHWCHVPGKEGTNLTLEEWKNLTLPREIDNKMHMRISKCKMYDFNWTSSTDEDFLEPFVNTSNMDTVPCKYGWDYDTTWFIRTIPSDEDWVCDKDIYVANTFMWRQFGTIIGTPLFGHLADSHGRRPIFFICLAVFLVGTYLLLITTYDFTLFAIVLVVGKSAALSLYQIPISIGMETTDSERRAQYNLVQCLGWTLGLCLIPFVFWTVRDWVIFHILTTSPCLIFFLLYKFMPESPSWLASKGKVEAAGRVLGEIAKTNGKELPSNHREILEKVSEKKETTYGLLSLFKTKTLAIRTLLMVFVWGVNGFDYSVVVLNINTLEGNPFLNFFLSSLSELPAYLMGMWVTEKYGRRWSQAFFSVTFTVSAIVAVFVATNPNLDAVVTAMAIYMRFSMCLTFYTSYLQGMEIFPTCLRQTGMAAGSAVSAVLELMGPYIVYLGTAFDVRYPYIFLAIINMASAIAVLYLPETQHRTLPTTLAEADEFGRGDDFWNFPWKKKPDQSQEMTNIPH